MVTRILVFCLLLVTTPSTFAAEFTAALDRTQITRDEHVLLTFTLVNSDTPLRAEGIAPTIDLSVLAKNFDLGQPKTTKQYKLYRGQGRSTATLSVQLFPKRMGTLHIPPFILDGLTTKPIPIAITSPSDNDAPEVFARAGVTKKSVWQREQLIVYLDLYTRVRLQSARLGGELDTEPMPIELLDYTILGTHERIEKHLGLDYSVTRRSWALFPKEAGILTLRFPALWLVSHAQRKIRLAGPIQTVQVRALPENVPQSLAVGKFTFQQSELTRTTDNNFYVWKFNASGPLPLTEFPYQLSLQTTEKLYADRAIKSSAATENGLINGASYTITAEIPTGRDFELPGVTWPYFDPELGVVAIAQTPSRTIAHQPSAQTPKANDSAEHPLIQPITPLAANNWWSIIVAIFACTVLLALLVWKKQRSQRPWATNNLPQPNQEALPHTPQHRLKLELLNALQARSLDQGLVEWEKLYGIHPQVRSAVHAVQRLCYSQDHRVDGDTQQHNVTLAIDVIRATSMPKTRLDPWSPSAFVATKTVTKN